MAYLLIWIPIYELSKFFYSGYNLLFWLSTIDGFEVFGYYEYEYYLHFQQKRAKS